jgi:hypothetical protein
MTRTLIEVIDILARFIKLKTDAVCLVSSPIDLTDLLTLPLIDCLQNCAFSGGKDDLLPHSK